MTRRFIVPIVLAVAATSSASADNPADPSVRLSEDRGHAMFAIGDDAVARYHIGPRVAKPYVFPVLAPGGIPVTRGWPMVNGLPKETKDHVHQKSAWFCHGDVIPEGVTVSPSGDKNVKGVDFWSEGKGHGIIACVDASAKGNVLTTKNEWRDSAGTKILDEMRTITLTKTLDGRLLVFDIALTASVCPLAFGDTKEGSFGVRVNDQMRLTAKGEKSTLVNADGKSGMAAVWGMHSDWCDYSGEVDGQLVGIAIFDDAKNPARAGWHSRDYGLMAANPFGRNASGFPAMKGKTDLVKLGKGETLKLRYGLFLHTGDAKTGKVAEAYQAFTKP
jgi:hypothetical protein